MKTVVAFILMLWSSLAFSQDSQENERVIYQCFSNHFQHHNLRADGNYLKYGKTYMNMLHALKVGGCFHYAPDLPFIEKYVDHKQYDLATYHIPGQDFKTTIIKRLQ